MPFDQITASRTQQATAASAVPWGCRAAESSVNEAGAAPTAGPDPVSSQAAQVRQRQCLSFSPSLLRAKDIGFTFTPLHVLWLQ